MGGLLRWQEQGSYQVTAALSGEHRPQAGSRPTDQIKGTTAR